MLSAAISLLFLIPAADPVAADFVIRGATVYDGSGKPGQKGDIAIRGDRIVAIGSFAPAGKPRIIAGDGLVVAPGFIDLHTHSDISIFVPGSEIPITEEKYRANRNYLAQGVTTIVTGNCGFGPVDVAGYFKRIDAGKAGTNVAHLVPHNDVRKQVMGNVNRSPSADELTQLKSLVDQGMKDGAWGMSTGLMYTPGSYARTEEIVELAKVVAARDGIYASHMRDESLALLISIQETLTVGQQAKLPVHISHLKARGRKSWGKAADAIAMIQQARSRGQTVTADQYPYAAASTYLGAVAIPAPFREGGLPDFLKRVEDAEQGPRVRKGMQELLDELDGGKMLRLASYTKEPTWVGKDIVTLAGQQKKSVVDLVIEIESNGGGAVVIFAMNDEDVRLIAKQDFVATASDGSAMLPTETATHPRSYGTFPRRVGRFAIEEKLLPLELAIRSASGLPADILRLPQRGYLKPDCFADVVVFDPQTFRDTATFDKPHQYATGVRYLFVNGVLAIDEGKYTDALAGKALRHIAKDK